MESTKTLSTRNELYTDYMVYRNLMANLSELNGTDWIPTTGSYRIRPSDHTSASIKDRETRTLQEPERRGLWRKVRVWS